MVVVMAGEQEDRRIVAEKMWKSKLLLLNFRRKPCLYMTEWDRLEQAQAVEEDLDGVFGRINKEIHFFLEAQ